MADFSAYEVIGSNNPARQISVTKWNALLGELETGLTAAGDVAKVALRTDLAAIAAPTAKTTRYLAEAGREGMFVFDSSNLAALVTADPRQGVYVAPTAAPTGASGAWVRKFDGNIVPQWFGAIADGVTDDYPAFAAALAYLKSIAAEPIPAWFYKGSPKLFVPAALEAYYLSETLDITHTVIIEGEGSLSGMQSRLKFADNKSGIRIQAYNTSGGATVDGATHYSGSYTILRNLAIIGGVEGTYAGFSGAEGDYHGVHARSNYIIEDCYIDGFRGDGVHAETGVGGGGALEGNSNCSFINRLFVTNVRNGLFLDAADSNAGTFIGVIGTYCRQHTVWDSSFLGNTHIGHHSANAGLVPGVAAAVVSYSGNRYFVKQGQAVGASTNAPSGTTADNSWWYYLSAGGAFAGLNIPLWTNGVSVREGGGFKTDSANGYNTFTGCYQEGGEALSQFISPTGIVGGLLTPKTTGNEYAGHRLVAPKGVHLGETLIEFNTGPTVEVAIVQNSADLATSYFSRLGIAQGIEADGTPCVLAQIIGYSIGTDPATNTGAVAFGARKAGGTFDTNHLLVFDPYNNAMFYPNTSNLFDFGHTAFRWKTVYAVTGNFSGAITASNLSGTNSGDGAYTIQTKITGYTATETAGDIIVKADLAAGFTIVLPTAVANKARFTFKKIQAAGAITIDGSGSETIDGALTAVLNAQNESITIVSDNANWMII